MKKMVLLCPLIFPMFLMYQHIMNILESYVNGTKGENSEIFRQSSSWKSRHLLEIQTTNTMKKLFTNKGPDIEPALQVFDCTNIHLIKVISKVGEGIFKQKYRAEFNGRQLIVKMITPETKEIKVCLDKIKGLELKVTELKLRCYGYGELRVIQEIIMLHEMLHAGFARLLGYCLRNSVFFDGDMNRQGLVSVYEYGEPVTTDKLLSSPWSVRLRQSLELAEFLRYIQESPLGSLLISNFDFDSFINVDSHIKLLDMDAIRSYDKECSDSSQCDFRLVCNGGQCREHNSIVNLMRMNDLFFRRLLLPDSYPDIIKSRVVKVYHRLISMSITTDELVFELQGIRDTAYQKIMEYLDMK